MKKYIFIALAAIAALSSCSKESPVSNEENGKEARVFTATMEDGITTKVTFDGTNKCALWEAGDAISIDGHQYTATSAGASSTFTGSGATETTHHAYFPASIYNGGTPTLPAEQTYAEGKFNMPMYAESSSLDLSFKNLCAVLAITVNKSNLVSTTTTSLKSIKVSSDKRMHGAFSATAAGVLSFTSQETLTDADKSVALTMTDVVDISTDKTFYIAIPAQDYSYLKIYLSADGSTYKEAMITQKAAGLGTIARSTMFNITYKTNAVQLYANGPYWATMNLGATTVAGSGETCYGDYYAWGETEPYYATSTWDDTNKKWLFNTWKTDKNSGYAWQSYCGQSSFTEWATKPYDDTSKNLTGTYDAATVKWGAGWRMPTGNEGEFKALTDNTSKAWTANYNGVAGYKFSGQSDYSGIELFFPAAGYGNGDVLGDAGTEGNYWSSTLNSVYTDGAYYLYFHSGSVLPQNEYYRYYGLSVRPVSD